MLGLLWERFSCQLAARKESISMQNRKLALFSVCSIGLIIVCFASSLWLDKQAEPAGGLPQEPVPTAEAVYQVTLAAVGDNLLHMPVVNSCKQENGGYDMTPLYENIRPILDQTDITAIGLETVLAGEEFGYSGYPAFNSPQAAGQAMAEAGFDLILMASNHAMDMGKKGLLNTLDFWGQYPGVTTAGAHATPADQAAIRVLDKGIRVAALNYTYGLNGIELTPERAHLVDLTDPERIRRDVEAARAAADFVVVFIHWGKEYVREIQPDQQKLAQYMADLGVDLIIGAHPHVLGPAEWLTGLTGNKTLVYYSLGNYISSQRKADNLLGGMARVTVTGVRDQSGKMRTEITEAALTPLVTYYDKNLKNFTVYPFRDYTPEIAAGHGLSGMTPQALQAGLDELYPAGCGVWVDY